MSRWMSNPQLLVEQAAGYRELAARGDLPGLARAVMKASCHNGSMTGPGADNLALLRALPDADRLALARIWADWLARVADEGPYVFEDFGRGPGYLRAELLTVASGVARDLDGDLLAAERQARLIELGERYVVASGNRDWELAVAELAAGRTPAPAVLAVFRRTALECHAEPALRELLAVCPGPVLNPGEPWADQALKDETAGGEPWQRLLAHTAPPTARAPSAKWARTGRSLLVAAGAEQVRHRVHAWFDLVGLDRAAPPLRSHQYGDIDAAGRPDPYNCQALRGLAWLLGLLPAASDTAAALARLADTALRPLPSGTPAAPKVAEAAVVALSLQDGAAARDELADLAHRVGHRGVARRIAAALGGG
ncbi:hypothetical protein ACH4SP_25730 [Streptomyces sp. NPDC021093]|uniref:hypothetical protein n=1 Tax=Streptomyces sp. NPDC021093 TaxID=3365112 RepID=UPI0037BA89BE